MIKPLLSETLWDLNTHIFKFDNVQHPVVKLVVCGNDSAGTVTINYYPHYTENSEDAVSHEISFSGSNVIILDNVTELPMVEAIEITITGTDISSVEVMIYEEVR